MKLLLDTCVWGGAKAELVAAGHDVVWTGDVAQGPGDEDILAQAHQEQRRVPCHGTQRHAVRFLGFAASLAAPPGALVVPQGAPNVR